MRDLQAIHSDRDKAREKIANAGQGVDTSQWQVEEMRYTDELKDATAYWDAIQAHEGRVQEATSEITTRLDTLYLGGQSLRELCADEEAYQIVRISFTQDYISQATKNSEVLSQVQTESQTAIKLANDRANELDAQNTILLQEKHKLTIELDDITSRFQALEVQLREAPSNEETEKLKQTVASLTAQLELKAKAEQPTGDTKSQVDALVQERENKKTKITNLRLADPSGINTKDYLAVDALSGDTINIHSNYVRSYKEISEAEAEQLRADAAAQNNIPEIPPLGEVVAEVAQPEETFQEEVQATDSGTTEETTGDTAQNEVVGEAESEVVVRATNEQRLHALEQSNLEMQTWIDSIEKRVAILDGIHPYINEDAEAA